MRIFFIILSAFILSAGHAFANPIFTLATPTQTKNYDQQQLAKIGLKTVRMNYNRAYPGVMMDFSSVRMCDLLRVYAINPDNTLEFIAEDNFSVFIPAKYLLDCNPKHSIAYLAIEPHNKWPVLFNHTNTTAGPFALIWTNPKRSYISDEYWAWSVTKVIERQSISKKKVIESPTNIPLSVRKQVLNGYQVYVSHCASCHTINHIGNASIGPDLSSPKTPLDYYSDIKLLKQFIRDPQSVRKIPNGRMSGSSTTGLHDDDLDDLIRYFQYIWPKNV